MANKPDFIRMGFDNYHLFTGSPVFILCMSTFKIVGQSPTNHTSNRILLNASKNLTNFGNRYPYAITPVCMAVKSHLRNQRPVVIAASTNDALAGAAKNIGTLRNYKNYYFVPLVQDDCLVKPFSLVADFKKIPQTIIDSLNGKQIQPVYIT